MAKEFTYEVVEEVATIQESQGSNWGIEVNKIAWNGKPPKIDIRSWNRDADNPKMGKGISLMDEGCDELVYALIQLGYGDLSRLKEILDERK